MQIHDSNARLIIETGVTINTLLNQYLRPFDDVIFFWVIFEEDKIGVVSRPVRYRVYHFLVVL